MAMWAMEKQPAIAAAHEIRPGRYPELSGVDLYEKVIAEFLAAHPLDPGLVDGLMTPPSPMAYGGPTELFLHEHLGDSLGLKARFSQTVNSGGATYSMMTTRACMAIATGQARAVLCLAAGRFPNVRGGGGGEAVARAVSHPDFEFIYGAFTPALYALSATRHMHERGTTRQALAAVAVSSREWALMHPDALMRDKGPITIAGVLESPVVATPFHRLDCSIPCDGGAAFLITTGEIARELTEQPAYIRGFGEYHGQGIVSQAPDFAGMGARPAAQAAFAMAGLTPADVDVAEIYDAFSINPIMFLEETGLSPAGKGGHFFLDGRGAPGGDLPVNTFGGLLSFGHTGDSSGMTMLVEGAHQVMGRAGARQQAEADVVLVHTYGGLMSEHCSIVLARQP